MNANVACPWHADTEERARGALSRRRKRGETHWTMFHCLLADHWHVIPGTFDEWCVGDPEVMRYGLAWFPTEVQWRAIFAAMADAADAADAEGET